MSGLSRRRRTRRCGRPRTSTWERIIRSCPNVAHWIDAEPISDGVAVMAKLEDRLHEFVVDGEPVVTGVLAG